MTDPSGGSDASDRPDRTTSSAGSLYPTARRAHTTRRPLIWAVSGGLVVILIGLVVVFYSPWRDRVEDTASLERLDAFIAALNTGDMVLAMSQVSLAPQQSAQIISSNRADTPVSFGPEVRKIADEPGRQRYLVTAHVGDQTRQLTWDVIEARQAFLLDGLTVLSAIGTPQPVPVWINGQLVGAEVSSVSALPGIYQVSSTTPWMSYAGQDRLDLLDRANLTVDQTIVVAPGTAQALAAAVSDWLDPCLASTGQRTDCGWVIDVNNGQVLPGSVAWEIDGARPTLDPTTATWEYTGTGWQLTGDLTYTTICSGSGTLLDGGQAQFTDARIDWVTHVTARMGDTIEASFVTDAAG